jgi:Holliday junction resolvase
MTSSYKKGYRLENAVFHFFEANGFYVARSAGSHGVFDVIAVRRGVVYGIQCKRNGKLTRAEKERILAAAKEYDIIPLLVYSKNRRYWVRNLMTGEERRLREFFGRAER